MKFDEGLDGQVSGYETVAPEYKVSFWSHGEHGDAWLEEWIGITEADADEVLRWAEQESRGRHYTVWARYAETETSITDIRLYGTEPTAPDDVYPPWARRHTAQQGPPTGAW